MIRRAPPRAALCAVFCVLLASTVGASCEARDHGYDIWFAGRVLAVDARTGLVRIARGPTETQDAAIIECSIARRALRHVWRGMEVEVEADTRSEPWHILRLRPLEYRVHPLLQAASFV